MQWAISSLECGNVGREAVCQQYRHDHWCDDNVHGIEAVGVQDVVGPASRLYSLVYQAR